MYNKEWMMKNNNTRKATPIKGNGRMTYKGGALGHGRDIKSNKSIHNWFLRVCKLENPKKLTNSIAVTLVWTPYQAKQKIEMGAYSLNLFI